MPIAGRYFAGAVYCPGDGRIYVFGGFDGVTFSEQTNAWAYDLVTDTWDTSLTPISVGIGGAGYSIVGDFAYLQGDGTAAWDRPTITRTTFSTKLDDQGACAC